MAMNRDVFLSILAMDSYDRGVGAGLTNLPKTGDIGNASIKTVTMPANSSQSGFEATAYDWAGETVISYRGTDFGNASSAALDVLNGWSMFTGLGANSQASMARQFFKQATQLDFPTSAVSVGAGSNITLVGHSLGGGLAGFVGARAFANATVFDPIPFGSLSWQSAISDAFIATVKGLGLPQSAVAAIFGSPVTYLLTDLITGSNVSWQTFAQKFAANIAIRAPDFSVVSGASLQGEIAASIDNYQTVIAGVLTGLGFQFLGLAQLGQAIADSLSGDRANIQTISNRGVLATPYLSDIGLQISLHSPAWITMALFGEKQWSGEGGRTDWQASFKYILPATADSIIAKSFGLAKDQTGATSEGEQLARLIAYSAINEGTRVFGDTGIRALFSDADDFGAGMSRLPSVIDDKAKTELGRLIAEYAGLLASGKVVAASKPDAAKGILDAATDAQGGGALVVDLRDETWRVTGQQRHSVVADKLVDELVSSENEATSQLAAIKGWYADNHGAQATGDLIGDIDSISISLSSGKIFKGIDGGIASLSVGSDSRDDFQFSASTDFVLAGKGADEIWGLGGNDILLGGSDGDVLVGGDGNDWLNGGSGSDVLWGGDKNSDDPSIDIDYVSYANESRPLRLMFDGTAAHAVMSVEISSDGSTDTLHSIENFTATSRGDSFYFRGVVPDGINLTINGGGAPGNASGRDFISFANIAGGGIRATLMALAGGGKAGFAESEGSSGSIKLVNFGTEIVGSDFGDTIFDGSSDEKIIDGGAGDDRLSIARGASILIGGEGNDTLLGGVDADVLIAGEGQDSIFGSDGNDIILADMQSRRVWSAQELASSTVFVNTISGGYGNDYISLKVFETNAGRPVPIYVRGDAGDDYVRIANTDTSNWSEPLPGGGNYSTAREIKYVYNGARLPTSGPGGPGPGPGGGFPSFTPGEGHDHIVLQDAALSDPSGPFRLQIENYDGSKAKFTYQILQVEDGPTSGYEGKTIYQSRFVGNLLIEFPGSSSDSITIENIKAYAMGFDKAATDAANLNSGWVFQFGLSMSVSFSTYSVVGPPPVVAMLNMNDAYVGQATVPSSVATRFLFGSVPLSLPPAGASPSPAPLPEGALAAPPPPVADTFGTAGNDEFTWSRGNRIIDGADGHDVFNLIGDITDFRLSVADGVITVADRWGLIGTTRLVNFEGVRSYAEDTVYTAADILAGAVPTTINRREGDGLANTLTGDGQRDRLNGLGGNDTLSGLGGDDVLKGGDGDDTLDGGEGDDTLDGGAGQDQMTGAGGDDRYYVDNAADTVAELPGGGIDTVFASIAHALSANVENLHLEGGAVSGTGNALANELYGNAALGDTLSGGDGGDLLFGLAGDDMLSGDAGDDALFGGEGNDTLTGGAGSDEIDGGKDAGGTGDTALFAGLRADYRIERIGDGSVRIVAVDGSGTDRLLNVERAGFLGEPEATRYVVFQKPTVSGPLAGLTVQEDAGFHVALPTGSFADPTGGALRYLVQSSDGAPLPDWLHFDGQAFTGTPPANYSGTLALTVTAYGGEGSVSAPINFVVQNVNDAPFQSSTIPDLSVAAGSTTFMGVTGYFTDPDGDSLTPAISLANGQAAPGWITVNSGKAVVIAPPSGANGHFTMQVTVSDGQVAASGTFKLTYGSGGNTAPTLANPLADAAYASGDAVSIAVSPSAFADADADILAYTATLANGDPLPAWLTFANGIFTGNAPRGGPANLAIKVTASDGVASISDTFDIAVHYVNTAPQLRDPLADAATFEDEAISFAVPSGTFADIDGDALTLTAALANGAPLPAWLTFDGQTFTGTPPADFSGAFEIRVGASDGALSASDVFWLYIGPVNDAPVLVHALPDVEVQAAQAVSIVLPGGMFADIDSAGLTLTARLADGSALPSWLALAGDTLAGTPPAGFSGNLDIVIAASDGGLTASDTFRLTVSGGNQPPVLAAALPDVASPEDAAVAFAIPAGSFTDADGTVLTYTARLANGDPLPAWLTLANGQFTGQPPANFTGALDITVTADDGAASASDTLRLTITPVNDAPVLAAALADVASPEDAAVSITIPAGSFTDADGTVLTYAATLANGDPLPAWLTLSNGKLTGTPPANFNGALAIALTASDGTQSAGDTFVLAITPVNDAPEAYADTGLSTPVGAALTIDPSLLLANDNDVDGDVLSITSVSGGTGGTAVIDAQGRIVFTPTLGLPGAATFQYTASDGSLAATTTVTVQVQSLTPNVVSGGNGNDVIEGAAGAPNQIDGGNGDDTITGGLLADHLLGGNGNDTVTGSGGNDTIDGGKGNDVLDGNGGADILTGGQGDDRITGGAGNDTIEGDQGVDTLVLAGLKAAYAVSTVNGVVHVIDKQPLIDGNDGDDTVSGIEKLQFRDGTVLGIVSPILLDLDGGGVSLTSLSQSHARFDLDGNGRRDRTSWVGEGDGILFLDRDGNGTVSGAGELSFIADLAGARTDLEGLAAFDGNGDGVLGVGDDRFDAFRVWRDGDGDGRTDKGEVLTLAQAGIASIALHGTPTNGDAALGDVIVVNTGTFTRTDGGEAQLLDAMLLYAPVLPVDRGGWGMAGHTVL